MDGRTSSPFAVRETGAPTPVSAFVRIDGVVDRIGILTARVGELRNKLVGFGPEPEDACDQSGSDGSLLSGLHVAANTMDRSVDAMFADLDAIERVLP